VRTPQPAALSVPLARGVTALPGGLAWLPEPRVLVAADAHLGYEDVVGGALPLWSTDEIVALLLIAIERMRAREVVFLGDVIHGATMSDGAARRVAQAVQALRERVAVTMIAGNHEGRARGAKILGATEEAIERDGWLLLHGDRPFFGARRSIIGHLHPSLHLSGREAVGAFVASEEVVVVPALTPYSSGLNALSSEFSRALEPWTRSQQSLHVVAATGDWLYPFGALQKLRALVQDTPRSHSRVRRRRLTKD